MRPAAASSRPSAQRGRRVRKACEPRSSCTARLDPLALPVRFTANDAVADERMRHIELHRERVILRRAVNVMASGSGER